MARPDTRTGSATLTLVVDQRGRWSARCAVRAPGGHWRTHTNAWLEFGDAPVVPQTLAEVERMMLAVLIARHPDVGLLDG